jgi:hypothetical protein
LVLLRVLRRCIQKFPDWSRRVVKLSATTCSCIAILWVSIVSFAAITLCVASQRVFTVVYFVMTESGNFWIHPRKFVMCSLDKT